MTKEQIISIWEQFCAALDMFQNAIEKCPDELWDRGDSEEYRFWYWTYHTLFWTDYYLDTEPQTFAPPKPYNMSEFDPEGILPDSVYTKAEMVDYTEHCRKKLRKLMNDFIADPSLVEREWRNDRRSYTLFEMALYNMRHVMHHTGQLNMLLGQINHDLPIWVSQTQHEL
jgi:hypothetical protein